MERLVNWLAERKRLNWLVVAGFFLFIIVFHAPVVDISVWIMKKLTRQNYDVVVGVISLGLLAFIVYYFIGKLREYKHATDLKIAYMLIITSLLLLHTQINFVMNIEIIHVAKYAILAILVFPLSRRFGDTVFYATLLGAIDELYEYRILYPEKTDYYDFNDIILNQMGTGFAIVLLYAAGVNNRTYPRNIKWYKSPVLISTVVIAIAMVVLYQSSVVKTYANPDGSFEGFVMSESSGPESFWRHLPNSDIVYHVIQPLEGLIIMVLLSGLFFLMDVLARWKVEKVLQVKAKSGTLLQGWAMK